MASRFKFGLDPVLRLRKRAFEDRQRIVAERLRSIGQQRSAIASLRKQIVEHADLSRSLQSSASLDVATVRCNRTHVVYLRREIVRGKETIRGHESELEREREAMVRASVELKAIEKLKERRWARYRAEAKRHETAEHGEFAIQMHRRQAEETNPGIRGTT